MSKIYIKVLFKGEDGSLGYRYNQWYDLIVYKDKKNTISRTDGTGYCEYETIYSFYDNWWSFAKSSEAASTGVKSVLQDWVMELPLRCQGTLMTAVRGCDDEPKQWTKTGVAYSPGRRLTAFIRWCFMVPADPREVGSEEGTFMMHSAPDPFKPSEFGHLPQHWYSHAMHALEIVTYFHPHVGTKYVALDLYEKMVHNMHLNIENREDCIRRLTEDRIANNTVVS